MCRWMKIDHTVFSSLRKCTSYSSAVRAWAHMLFVVIAFIVCILPDAQRWRQQQKCSDNNICRHQVRTSFISLCVLSLTTTTRAMWTISHCVQVHDLLILAMTVRKVDNEALVRKRTIREPSAGHELSITHRAQAHQLLITGLTTIICPWRYPQSERPRHLHHITRWRQQQQRRWQQQMSTTRPHGQKYGIFLLRCVKATTTAKISDDKRQLSDDEALCLSTQHIHITSRDVNNDNGNQTSRR